MVDSRPVALDGPLDHMGDALLEALESVELVELLIEVFQASGGVRVVGEPLVALGDRGLEVVDVLLGFRDFAVEAAEVRFGPVSVEVSGGRLVALPRGEFGSPAAAVAPAEAG